LVGDRAVKIAIGDKGGAPWAVGVAAGNSVCPAECATDAETLLITEKRFVKIEHREIRYLLVDIERVGLGNPSPQQSQRNSREGRAVVPWATGTGVCEPIVPTAGQGAWRQERRRALFGGEAFAEGVKYPREPLDPTWLECRRFAMLATESRPRCFAYQ